LIHIVPGVFQPSGGKGRKIDIFVIENGGRSLVLIDLHKPAIPAGIDLQRIKHLGLVKLFPGKERIRWWRIYQIDKYIFKLRLTKPALHS
jgi:hypothetical protein